MPPVQWHCECVALFDSQSAPDGPVYSVVETFSLVKRKKVRE
jgi:2'-5' RNA ligase